MLIIAAIQAALPLALLGNNGKNVQELIRQLGIDWKLLIAQIINFAILFFLLKKFLLKPILGLLEARRQKIEKSLKDAERIEKELTEIKEKREDILKNANQKAEEILGEAKEIAESRKTEIINATKKESEKILEEAKISIEREKQKLVDEARGDIAELVILATEKIVKEKLDEEKDRELVKEVLTKIES